MKVLDEVLERVTPDTNERKLLEEAYNAVRSRARHALQQRDIDPSVELVGSAARDTWLSGDRDIDVFLLLPKSLDREEFRDIGLDVGKEVFPEGTVEYAEHPYVSGTENGYDVDIVPCYDLESTSELRSAVDRTPFHNEYVKNTDLDGDEVRLLKAFMRGAGIYGSDLRTRGFSGYLTELLVLYYGGFQEVVEASADWDPPVEIDIKNHGVGGFDDPLIVVDPTDPERNVAAVVSRDSFARFVDWSREWLKEPRVSLFFPDEREPLGQKEFREILDDRDTTLLCVRFDSPDLVDDQLFPQLKKTETGLSEELERRGFDIIRSTVWAGSDCVLLVELNIGQQSRIEKHWGPPVHVREHAEKFKEKYTGTDVVGPYIEDGKYVVERRRKHPKARGFVESDDFLEIGMGKHVEKKVKEGYDVLCNEECEKLLTDFGSEFRDYFDP